MTLLVEVIKLKRASPSARPSLTPQVVGFDHFGDKSREILGFRQSDLRHIHGAFNWPATITCRCGETPSHKDFKVDGVKAFMFMLYRHHMPTNLTHSESDFGWDYSVASRAFAAAED